ncbi:hypothetical protein [Bdellovibrio bacteriovorus]|uniref:hypothetical protein n=2 Tax=Bdellovibrio bacteriovorus TaxID=959 RepID=UPI00056F0EE5|nr:hypothetical protein [Bdellovibrio bacteriovorus]
MSNQLMALGSFLFLFLHAFLVAQPASAAEVVQVGLIEDVLRDYKLFLQERDPVKITKFDGKHSRRDVVEVVLFMQALRHGKFAGQVQLVGLPSTGRLLEQLRKGKVAALANSAWAESVPDSEVLKTEPLIRDGEFVVGIYTRPGHQKLLNAKLPEHFPNFSAVTNPDWGPDVKALHNLNVGKVFEVGHWELMTKMVSSGRVDFTLAPFRNTPDKTFSVGKEIYVPVQNYKVNLKGTRHWMTSKKHPGGMELHQALEKGRHFLDQEGILHRAYRESGFFQEDVKDWMLLNR